MKWLNFKNIKNSSVYVTPNLPILSTTSYKFSLFKALGFIGLYTLVAWFVLIVILSVTPLKDFLFVADNNELKTQNEKIQQLRNRVILLTEQLQALASTNERLKFAVKLAEKDSISPKDPLYDTLQKTIKKKIKIGGNVFEAFNLLLDRIFQEDQNSKEILFLDPTKGIVIQVFNPSTGHFGIDYGVKTGSPIYASAGGLVIFSDYTVDSGFMMIIQHDNNFTTIYKHCSSLFKKAKDVVITGELIALSGNSGKNTTGPHLHFEIWQKGKPVDPQILLVK